MAAVAAAPAVWVVADPVLGYDLTVEQSGGSTMTVSAPFVLVTALVASLAGWAALAILERFAHRAGTIWTVAATVVLVASLGMPFTASTTTSTAVILSLMHVAVGAVLIPILARSAR
ncbi:MAG: hypothetical protein GEV04_23940 [Actinophytocola sp.]|nr:hypothetical protein [Actinophytocola sp.]